MELEPSERQGVSKQEHRLQWEQRKRELRAQQFRGLNRAKSLFDSGDTVRFPDYQHDPEL